MSELGVYIHYPWCRKVCPYCDFAVEVGTPDHDGYADAVIGELRTRAEGFTGPLASIYFGGGTPALWRPDCLARVIGAVRDTFAGTPREITLEANPTDCTEANLAAWRELGIDRLSIGVQSTSPDELVMLGRDHRFGDGPAALARAIAHGGFTTTCDLILGVPVPGRRALELSAFASADHLSMYELTIEARTVFGKRVANGTLVPLDEDALAELYASTHDTLVAAGFEHYEISSYARPGKRAVHNSLYWRGEPFIGLGVGAASLEIAADGSAKRATNPRRVAEYMPAPGQPAEVLTSTPEELRADRAWLGMRTSDGIAAGELPAELCTWLVGEGLAERRGERICPTLRGFLMNDTIAARIAVAL